MTERAIDLGTLLLAKVDELLSILEQLTNTAIPLAQIDSAREDTRIVRLYRDDLVKSVQNISIADLVKSAAALTSVNKGLADSILSAVSDKVGSVSMEVLSLAIKTGRAARHELGMPY